MGLWPGPSGHVCEMLIWVLDTWWDLTLWRPSNGSNIWRKFQHLPHGPREAGLLPMPEMGHQHVHSSHRYMLSCVRVINTPLDPRPRSLNRHSSSWISFYSFLLNSKIWGWMSSECQLCSNHFMPIILIFNIIFKRELSLFINKDAEMSKVK